MKSSIPIALIVCGTILVALPYVQRSLVMRHVAQTMIVLKKPVNLSGGLPRNADLTCIIGGFIMILVGASSGLRQDLT